MSRLILGTPKGQPVYVVTPSGDLLVVSWAPDPRGCGGTRLAIIAPESYKIIRKQALDQERTPEELRSFILDALPNIDSLPPDWGEDQSRGRKHEAPSRPRRHPR